MQSLSIERIFDKLNPEQKEAVTTMASPRARVPKKEIERAAEAIMKRLL
jgi:hypothetical protein